VKVRKIHIKLGRNLMRLAYRSVGAVEQTTELIMSRKTYVNLPDDVVHATVEKDLSVGFGYLSGSAYTGKATNRDGTEYTAYANSEGEALSKAVSRATNED
jgi:hypothetical protein